MLLVAGFFSWWFGAGWRGRALRAKYRLSRASEFFSLSLLVRTLFSPYRQVSAGAVRGNLSIQWRAFVDRTVSRFVGFFVRTGVLLMGVVSVILLAMGHLALLLIWPFMPILPLAAAAFALAGMF